MGPGWLLSLGVFGGSILPVLLYFQIPCDVKNLYHILQQPWTLPCLPHYNGWKEDKKKIQIKTNKQKTQIFYPIHCFFWIFCQRNRVVPNTTRKSSLIPGLNHEKISNLHWTNKRFSKKIYYWGFRSQSIKPHCNCEEEQIHGPWELEATEHDYKESVESMSLLWNNLMVYCEEVSRWVNKNLNDQ